MKNIHLISTDKPSRLSYLTKRGKEVHNDLRLFEKSMSNILDSENQNIFITSNEEIKEKDWFYYKHFGEDIVCKYNTMNGQNTNVNEHKDFYKKIILTTDQDLIKDGVQAIDNDFLEWFVKNPSCENANVNDWLDTNGNIAFGGDKRYQICNHLYDKILIPKVEPKQFEDEFEMQSRIINKVWDEDEPKNKFRKTSIS